MHADSDRLSQMNGTHIYLFIALGFGASLHIRILVTLSVSDARVAYIIYITLYDCSPYILAYTSHSVKVFPMQFVRARALEYDVNIGRGTP